MTLAEALPSGNARSTRPFCTPTVWADVWVAGVLDARPIACI